VWEEPQQAQLEEGEDQQEQKGGIWGPFYGSSRQQ